jgi:hypothetical protein
MMVAEAARNVPVRAMADVLVLGGGPAGFAAAVTAGRLGGRTILVESSGMVGGVATAGLMSHWTGATEGPLYEELLERARDTDRDWPYFGDKILEGRRIINPEKLKLVMLEMLEESKVEILLYTLAVEPLLDGKQLRGVFVESKAGREAILAKVTVDASGDGDIAARAGVPFVMGRESDGSMQPVTVMFKVGGVDMEKAIFPGEFEDDFPIGSTTLQALGRSRLPPPNGHVLLYPSTLPGVVSVNMTNATGVDGTDPAELTRGEIVCRRQIPMIVDFLREYVPGFETCFLLSTSATLGVRETRHFKGEYTLTEEDILAARDFDDWIVTRAYFNFDIHNMTGPGLDPTGAQASFEACQRTKYSIPLRSFIPLGVDGLLLAGRDISGTHRAHSNYRVMPICVNMGQGVGSAAFVCVRDGLEPRELKARSVQELLERQGVRP